MHCLASQFLTFTFSYVAKKEHQPQQQQTTNTKRAERVNVTHILVCLVFGYLVFPLNESHNPFLSIGSGENIVPVLQYLDWFPSN